VFSGRLRQSDHAPYLPAKEGGMAESLKEAQHKGRFMAVAVKKDAEVGAAGGSVVGLAGATLAGVIYVILGFYLVYYGIYYVWEQYLGGGANAGLFNRALLVILMIGGAGGLVLLYPRFLRPQPGLRAGVGLGVLLVFLGFVALYYLAWIMVGLLGWLAPGLTLDQRLYVAGPVLAIVALALLRWGWRSLRKESVQQRLRSIEDQGWFSIGTYKKGQGLKARRGTMLGLILVVGSGVWAYGWKRGIASGTDWTVTIPPFMDVGDWKLLVLRSSGIVVPLLIGAATVWFSYRLINYPRFADFLIATEAEMNKVSWASQRKLVQDTIVVLTVLVLMTVFLFVVDLLWSFLLTKINVLLQ
jgi:preprotein translocase SecE subunit